MTETNAYLKSLGYDPGKLTAPERARLLGHRPVTRTRRVVAANTARVVRIEVLPRGVRHE